MRGDVHRSPLRVASPASLPAPEPVSYGRRISQLAAERPNELALLFAARDGSERACSWAELERRALQVAALLGARGVGQGSLLALGLRNSPEHVLATLAAWKLGACVLPLRWDLPAWERDRLLELARPALVIASDWTGVEAPLLSLDEVRASESGPAPALPDRVADPARALASSGSTGRPKLILKPGRGETVPGQTLGRVVDAPPGTATELIPAPLYHTNGFMLVHAVLQNGDRALLMERFDAAQAADLIERHRVQFVTMVPTMLLRIARLPDFAGRDFSSLLAVLQGGAPCPAWLVRAWFERVGPERFWMTYGSTENAGLSRIRGDEWLTHPGSVGRPFNSEFRILDEAGRELPPGEVGEIYGRSTISPGPSFAYVGAPPARSTADGFASVGDLGWLDAEGYLYIADRRTDLVITGGANVFPAEVEAALLEHPDVADAAVIGLPDPEWGQRVHALWQARDPARPPAVEALREHCRARLVAYKVPKSFERVAALPRSDAGKLSRSALVEARVQGGSSA
jgi:bile acid-coenzyme A ligase